MANHKPLPALPSGLSLAALSTDARAHRSRLIRHILSEIQDPAVQGRRERWAFALEQTLDDLSRCIVRGDWLAGIRRRRESRYLAGLDMSDSLAAEGSLKIPKEGQEISRNSRAQSPVYAHPPLSPQPPIAISPVEETRLTRVRLEDVLRQLRAHLSRDDTPSLEQQKFHLLLCLAPYGAQGPLPLEDHGFDIIPANVGCTFTPAKFLIPSNVEHVETSVLFGINEWDDIPALRVVGGTFSLKGVDSLSQHETLAKVLRTSIYIHLSLLLEQQFLSDSHIHIQFPRPKFALPSSSAPFNRHPETPQTIEEAKGKPRSPFLRPGILSFFSRRKGLSRRAETVDQTGSRGSLDLISTASELVQEAERSPRSSVDGGLSRLTRFSLIGERRPFLRPTPKENRTEAVDGPFITILKDIELSGGLLSTSVGVTFCPPPLIIELAAKETKTPNRRLRGDEKTGLTGLLGWSSKETAGRGMSGIPGFVRQQELSFLRSRYVLAPTPTMAPDGLASMSGTSTVSSCATSSVPGMISCGRPQWLTYRYYSHDPQEDRPLGEAIFDFLSTAHLPCERPGCAFKCGQHENRLIHGGHRITIKIESPENCRPPPNPSIEMWESCAICNAETSKSIMTNGAYLFSYGKFLELMIYSSSLGTLSPSLCEHTTPPLGLKTSPPESRLNIIRHFSIQSGIVSFSISTLDDIFELRVPRLQMNSSVERVSKATLSEDRGAHEDELEEERKLLRREIKVWWEGVADHMDKLEHLVAGEDSVSFLKALPRLPSGDDAYEDFESPTTPKAKLIGLPPSIPPNTPVTHPSAKNNIGEDRTPTRTMQGSILYTDDSDKMPTVSDEVEQHTASVHHSEQQPQQTSSEHSTLSVLTSSAYEDRDPSELLGSLRHTFQRAEHSLYAQLSRTPATSLNDVRRAFLSDAKGAHKRLYAWQKKHLKARVDLAKDIHLEEPEWWSSGCHVIPGSNIIVREDDLGSIIAFTLSSADYYRELANLSRTSPTSQAVAPSPAPSQSSNSSTGTSSFFTAGKLFGSSISTQLDPDHDDVVWHELEACSATISRKEHTRDPTSILSIREVLRQKSPADASSGLSNAKLNESQVNLASVYAKPDVGISMEAVGGEVSVGRVTTERAGKILQDLEAVASGSCARPETAESHRTSTSGSGSGRPEVKDGTKHAAVDAQPPVSPASDQFNTVTSIVIDTHIKRGKASSILSLDSEATVGRPDNQSTSDPSKPPIPPPKEAAVTAPRKELPPTPNSANHQPTSSSFTNTITSGLNMAMRFVMNQSEAPKVAPLPPKKYHNLLLVDSNNIDERPHIKYDWTIGKRLKFSCTVYYARQFDLMRKRCGIDDTFLRSLSRSINWAAVGGKSRSNFWKTADEKFIIKTLVNAWNVADLWVTCGSAGLALIGSLCRQVLIELAPSYFRYIESTANKATVLAKLIGFYTIEIRNLETGTIQTKADLLVMENLFYDQKINKTFDLKGIQGRKVKAKQDGSQASKTLFDGEWIEGQQRTLMLLHPHSKSVLREAIRSDAEFLARSNIMDYSLLLGVDEEKKQIVCGLVDTIGSYTFAKTLEYKAKHNLHSGKDVTVVPPIEYQERFVNALENYFVACPDKWSKPPDEAKVLRDLFALPSVL